MREKPFRGMAAFSHAAPVASFFTVGQPRPSWPIFAILAAVSRPVAKKPQDAAIVANHGNKRKIVPIRGRLAGTIVGTTIFGRDKAF